MEVTGKDLDFEVEPGLLNILATQVSRSRVAAFFLALAALWALLCQTKDEVAFAGAPLANSRMLARSPWSIAMFADKDAVVDVVDEDSDDEEFDDDEEDEEDEKVELKKDYAFDEKVPQAWYDKRRIDRHKVNMVLFDMFKKPVEFFPHKLKAGDTIRVYYLEANRKGEGMQRSLSIKKDEMRETYLDGTIMNFEGEYHTRFIIMRTMTGKGNKAVGFEMKFHMHSPLVTKIQVMRRGYIGRAKNAYFIRGLVGKQNAIPLDKERTQMDKMYVNLRLEGRADEVPESEYPQQEWDQYPLPVWKQDQDDWDEADYAPEKVDQRTEFELRVIAKYRMRPSKTGKYGTARAGTR
eukprot:TRINITY_DN1883_c0_g1_i2.p1 TRINITY_DN1883_c0_g1~~TRINITY_DN1883_c0_g1_i2.p1  ORF type:complete len:369 (+),score=75.20 TRINITY_DN1883_c0_g1_i2:57-1109(+)